MKNQSMKLQMRSVFVLCLSFTMTVSSSVWACSAFHLVSNDNQELVGKNFDWDHGHGLVIVNKRNLEKTALLPPIPSVKLAKWISKYASITFNQISRDFPQGGMNERGLVIETLYLESTEHPKHEDIPYANELQWVQYQLDTAESILEVQASLNNKKIGIYQVAQPVHYFICDPINGCAVLELIKGKVKFYNAEKFPNSVITNHPYKTSLDYLHKVESGEHIDAISDEHSLNRFVRACQHLKECPVFSNGIDRAFTILDKIADKTKKGPTQWSIVYDIKNLEVNWSTKNEPQRKSIHLRDFDFTCLKLAQIADVDSHAPNQANLKVKFSDYTLESNRRIVELSLKNFGLPKEAIEQVVHYPDSALCQK